MKKIMIITFVVIGIIFVPPFILPVLVPWTGINCQHQEINIKTGQVRYIRKFWFLTVSQRIKNTMLSEAVKGQVVNVADIEPWHRVNTYSLYWNYSPHYRYHGALSQIYRLETFTDMQKLLAVQKKKIATEILTAWQKSGNDDRASVVISELEKKAELCLKSSSGPTK